MQDSPDNGGTRTAQEGEREREIERLALHDGGQCEQDGARDELKSHFRMLNFDKQQQGSRESERHLKLKLPPPHSAVNT